MYLRTRLKLGEINNLSDARYAAALGAEFMGFNFTPSHPQYLPPSEMGELLQWVEGPQPVAEWDEMETEIILDTCKRLELAFIQLNTYTPGQAKALAELNIIQNLAVDNAEMPAEVVESVIEETATAANFFMLSFASSEIQEAWLERNEEWAKQLCSTHPVWLNAHFSPDNLLRLLDTFQPYGINLRGSSEERVGYRDFEDLNALVEQLEV